MPPEYITIPSANRTGHQSPLRLRKAEHRPVIELEAPVSQIQTSSRVERPMKRERATPADSSGTDARLAVMVVVVVPVVGAELSGGGLRLRKTTAV